MNDTLAPSNRAILEPSTADDRNDLLPHDLVCHGTGRTATGRAYDRRQSPPRRGVRHWDMFDRWFATVRSAMDADLDAWGLAERYQATGQDASQEGIAKALSYAGFHPEPPAYPKAPSLRAAGVVSHWGHPNQRVRYELKSIFIPQYQLAEDPHKVGFEKRRLEDSSGALDTIDRLREAEASVRVFLLLGASWGDRDDPERFALHEDQRDALLDGFERLARLAAPSATHSVRGNDKSWSGVARAWVIA